MIEMRHSTNSDSANSTLTCFKDSPSRRDLDGTRRNSNFPLFDLRTIIAATDNFSIANKLGQGGFGPVYKVVSFQVCLCIINSIMNVYGYPLSMNLLCAIGLPQIIHQVEFLWTIVHYDNDIWTLIVGLATKWNGNSSKKTIKMLRTRNRTIQNRSCTNC